MSAMTRLIRVPGRPCVYEAWNTSVHDHASLIECYLDKKPIRTEYLIVDQGKLAGAGAHSYTAGDATKGSEEATKFNRSG